MRRRRGAEGPAEVTKAPKAASRGPVPCELETAVTAVSSTVQRSEAVT